MKEINCIGVLTSGGDAPGMNAAVRAVVRAALHYNKKVIGINNGYKGLIEGDIVPMVHSSVSSIIHKGGTILKTARCKEFTTPEGVELAAKKAREMGMDALVVVGGDGSFRGALDLSKHGFPVIGIPATIDNDIACSDYALGYDTALNTVCEAIDKIRDTCASHDRCNVVEVMGRGAGFLALHAAVATGAEAYLVPEIEFDFKDIYKKIKENISKGKSHFIVVAAEGITKDLGGADAISKRIEENTGVETRATVLGYIQRGGNPTVRDRFIASQMGLKAVELLLEGQSQRVVVVKEDKIVHYDIGEALSMKKDFDFESAKLSDYLNY